MFFSGWSYICMKAIFHIWTVVQMLHFPCNGPCMDPVRPPCAHTGGSAGLTSCMDMETGTWNIQGCVLELTRDCLSKTFHFDVGETMIKFNVLVREIVTLCCLEDQNIFFCLFIYNCYVHLLGKFHWLHIKYTHKKEENPPHRS